MNLFQCAFSSIPFQANKLELLRQRYGSFAFWLWLAELCIFFEWLASWIGLILIVYAQRVTHATPAAAYAHSPSRHWESFNGHEFTVKEQDQGCADIASQLVDDNSFINGLWTACQSKCSVCFSSFFLTNFVTVFDCSGFWWWSQVFLAKIGCRLR